MAPSTAIAERPMAANVSTRSATSQESSRPLRCIHSTNRGTNTDVRIPPSASS